MEQNINIAALLKDCPKGTKLYSPICGECELDYINVYRDIVIRYNEQNTWSCDRFTEFGRYSRYSKGECLLFPSKEIRDWGYFNVKYIKYKRNISYAKLDKKETVEDSKIIQILKKNGGVLNLPNEAVENLLNEWREMVCFIRRDSNSISWVNGITSYDKKIMDYILSTGMELKLEEEQPQFKVGDVVKVYNSKGLDMGIYLGGDYNNALVNAFYKGDICFADDYATIEHYATPEEIAKWNKETLEPNHLHYSKSKRKIIDWFLPFDKVVVRYDLTTPWRPEFFYRFDKEMSRYKSINGMNYGKCLPYNEKTAKLIGTNDVWA